MLARSLPGAAKGADLSKPMKTAGNGALSIGVAAWGSPRVSDQFYFIVKQVNRANQHSTSFQFSAPQTSSSSIAIIVTDSSFSSIVVVTNASHADNNNNNNNKKQEQQQ